MSCQNNWDATASQMEGKGFVPTAGVDGSARCIKGGCTALINKATGRCLDGHSQAMREIEMQIADPSGSWNNVFVHIPLDTPEESIERVALEVAYRELKEAGIEATSVEVSWIPEVEPGEGAFIDEHAEEAEIYQCDLVRALLCVVDERKSAGEDYGIDPRVVYARYVQAKAGSDLDRAWVHQIRDREGALTHFDILMDRDQGELEDDLVAVGTEDPQEGGASIILLKDYVQAAVPIALQSGDEEDEVAFAIYGLSSMLSEWAGGWNMESDPRTRVAQALLKGSPVARNQRMLETVAKCTVEWGWGAWKGLAGGAWVGYEEEDEDGVRSLWTGKHGGSLPGNFVDDTESLLSGIVKKYRAYLHGMRQEFQAQYPDWEFRTVVEVSLDDTTNAYLTAQKQGGERPPVIVADISQRAWLFYFDDERGLRADLAQNYERAAQAMEQAVLSAETRLPHEAISRPLTPQELRDRKDEDGYVSGVVRLPLGEVATEGHEPFLNRLSEALVGNELLMDIHYQVVGHAPGETPVDAGDLLINVSGDVTTILEDLDDED